MPNAAPRPSRIFLALLLIGALTVVTFLSCSRLTPEKISESLIPSATLPISNTSTQAPLFSIQTPTVTPPIVESQGLSPRETPVIVKGIINPPDSSLEARAGPRADFPLLADLNNKVIVDVIGKSQGGQLYVSYSNADLELTGWVVDKYVLIEDDDLNKISFVQIVTPTEPRFCPKQVF